MQFLDMLRFGLCKSGVSSKQLAFHLGKSEGQLSRMLAGDRPWRAQEIDKAFEKMGLTVVDTEAWRRSVMLQFMVSKFMQAGEAATKAEEGK